MQVVCLNTKNYLGMGGVYVEKLANMARRNLTVPYEFVCITDGVREGWWGKLDLLNMFEGEVLYFDLDVVISTNVDKLVEIGRSDPSRLWARNDFGYPVSLNSKIVGDGYAGPLMENGREATINSSVMYWRGKYDVPKREGVHGDQGCITAALWPDRIGLFPDSLIRSHKYQGNGDVTVYHGHPKPHEVNDEYVREHWR